MLRKIAVKTTALYFCVVLTLSAQTIDRGPYLQKRTGSEITVRFNSTTDFTSSIKFGTNPLVLSNTVNATNYTKIHTVKLEGLIPNTKYYYAIYNGNNKVIGDSTFYFKTTQIPNSKQKISIWATGDCGTGYDMQTKVKNAFNTYFGNRYLDAWILLGDNAYNDGRDNEYQAKFFNPYSSTRFLKQTCIYPAPGNHDYGYFGSPERQSHTSPYFSIFNVFQNGESGGVASNHKEYYSYDIGNVHMISLDSYGQETANNYTISDTLSPQIVWLKQDLAANTKKWTIVYFHHPPYTMGSHNSDNELDLKAIRQNLTPILERFNVDLVLNGHSHNYERSKLIKNHTGNENTYNANIHAVSTSSGLYDGSNNSCPYIKKSDNSIKGIVYAVSGSAGKITGYQASYPHEALPHSETVVGGSLLIEVEDDRLDAIMINENGGISDKFTMMKDVNQPLRIVEIPDGDQPVEITSPYKANTIWNNVLGSDKFTVMPTGQDQFINVKDTKNCLEDVLKVHPVKICPESRVVLGTSSPGNTLKLNAMNTISAERSIPQLTKYIVEAGHEIVLNPGFETKQNVVFSAQIKNCQN